MLHGYTRSREVGEIHRSFHLQGTGRNTLRMSSIRDPNQNHRLATMLAAEYDRLATHLELVPMLLGDVL
jgi:hypothetical protein